MVVGAGNGHWVMGIFRERPGMQDLPTAYFFAGGAGRSPSLKLDAYCLFLNTKFFCTGVDILPDE